ncbi:unnamed protein product, partial [marine sediment metagenome]
LSSDIKRRSGRTFVARIEFVNYCRLVQRNSIGSAYIAKCGMNR